MAMTNDYFELFDIKRQFDIDPAELNRRYIALQMKYHPDVAGNDADSATVNSAYNTLLDPIKRAEYLVKLIFGEKTVDKADSCPIELFEVMEELSEADEGQKIEIRNNLNKMLSSSLEKISGLFARNDAPDAIASEINKAKYIRKMLSE